MFQAIVFQNECSLAGHLESSPVLVWLIPCSRAGDAIVFSFSGRSLHITLFCIVLLQLRRLQLANRLPALLKIAKRYTQEYKNKIYSYTRSI